LYGQLVEIIRRALAALVTTALLVCGLAAPAQAARAPKFVKHSGHFWVWFGPASWDASYSSQGITASSSSGLDVLDLGFSNLICTTAPTWKKSVTKYFANTRAGLRKNGFTIEKKSALVHPSGTGRDYRRQALQVRVRSGGVTYRGVFTYDYDFAENVDGLNYCYQRSLAKYAPASRWNTMKATLTKVQNSLAYSGPGVGRDPGEDPVDP
jgi:hypothetical protein